MVWYVGEHIIQLLKSKCGYSVLVDGPEDEEETGTTGDDDTQKHLAFLLEKVEGCSVSYFYNIPLNKFLKPWVFNTSRRSFVLASKFIKHNELSLESCKKGLIVCDKRPPAKAHKSQDNIIISNCSAYLRVWLRFLADTWCMMGTCWRLTRSPSPLCRRCTLSSWMTVWCWPRGCLTGLNLQHLTKLINRMSCGHTS